MPGQDGEMKQNHYLALLFQNNIHQQTMKRTMKYTCLSLLILFLTVSAMAQPTFTYREKTIRPDKHNYLIDAALTNDVIHPDTYVFRSLKDALRAAEKQLASNQSKRRTVPGKGISLYIAPGVYWIDDPDAPEVRHPLPGEGIPYGMKLKVSNLRLIGLTDNPEEVVIASNRGQTLGAVGNFTMLHFDGDDIQAENITFGNYCNVDLIYPLNEKLNRKKRSETIVQAQLIICNSDRVVARNCRFISRLNSCPFAGARRALFDNCYFECTDDALCGTGVYLNSRFTFFSGKPFYSTQGTGAVFLNCDIHSLTRGRQYLVKVGSPVTIVDCRWTSEDPELFIGWTQDPTDDLCSYQYNLTLNGKPLFINTDRPWLTVDMTDKNVLEAYRLEVPKVLFHHQEAAGDTVIYNLYNLLSGNDGWDPTEQKPVIKKLGKQRHGFSTAYTRRSTQLRLSQRKAEIESGVDSMHIKADWLRFGTEANFDSKVIKAGTHWHISPKDSAFVELIQRHDGSCIVKGKNNSEETHTVNIIAGGGKAGLKAACVVTVKSRFLEAPAFISRPHIVSAASYPGQLSVDYQLDLQGRTDQSLITWYRCTDAAGSNVIPVAVSRLNKPERTYALSPADNGYYIKVSVSPKHLRCHAGPAESAITESPVDTGNDKTEYIETDFRNFPVNYQPRIIPGFWTVDSYKPVDTQDFDWTPNPQNCWIYGKGVDGAANATGLLQASKGARLLYTPVAATCGNMHVSLTVDPCKTAGQGFGSATGQYMDIYIKFDTRTLTGYALRIIRTTKHDRAVDFILMRYEKGVASPISPPVSSICYRTDCKLELSIVENRFTAHAETSTQLPAPHRPGLTATVDLEAEITPNTYGGTGIQHTGSTGASATMLRIMKIEWD